MRTFAGILLFCCALASKPNLQNSGLRFVETIPVPNWKVGVSNTDLFGFNPVTRIMYLADRTNHAIDVIDTHTNAVTGMIHLASNTVPNQPLVAIDLQDLVVSDGLNSVLVWHLTTPSPSQPDVYPMPGTTPDGMDYDTINQTVYVVTDDAPYYLVGISLVEKKIVTTKTIPFSADLIKFNPIDGKIYISMEDADHMNAAAGIGVYDPVTDTITTPSMYTLGPACPAHGIDIDPISDVAVLGCFGGTSNGNIAVNLKTGAHVAFPDVGGTDSIVFNPNLRRFYSGSGLNTAATSGCPSTPNAPPFGALTPVVGVFDARRPTNSAPAVLDGVACTGRGNHIAGVDPIRNNVYVPVAQFPADPNSTTTGVAGILLFHDVTPPAQSNITSATAHVSMVSNGNSDGAIQMAIDGGRRFRVTANFSGIAGSALSLTIPTTVANEIVHCAVNTTKATASCDELLLGDPLVGSVVTLAIDGSATARGTIESCEDRDDHGACRDRSEHGDH